MKKALTTISALILSLACFAQIDYKQRAEDNLKYLIKDPNLHNIIKMDNKGITIYSPTNPNKPEAKIFWSEAEFFLRLIKEAPYEQMISYYDAKGIKPFHSNVKKYLGMSKSKSFSSLKGMKIAIDPGHFANSKRQAFQESRFVLFKQDSMKYPSLPSELFFYESNLNYLTAQYLKILLENEGAIVFLSRSPGESAVGKSFDAWYKADFQTYLDNSLANGDINQKTFDYYSKKASPKEVFNNIYKQLDFISRSRRINAFNPDVSIIIHYNASENSNANPETPYLEPVDYNYSSVFIPGGFLYSELRKKDARIDFLRLLLSNEIESSYQLSTHFIKSHQDLGIQPMNSDSVSFAQKSIVRAPGIYHRNLYLTRSIKSPLIYGESLLQDNIDVMNWFKNIDSHYNSKDLENPHIRKIAETYFNSIKTFVNNLNL